MELPTTANNNPAIFQPRAAEPGGNVLRPVDTKGVFTSRVLSFSPDCTENDDVGSNSYSEPFTRPAQH